MPNELADDPRLQIKSWAQVGASQKCSGWASEGVLILFEQKFILTCSASDLWGCLKEKSWGVTATITIWKTPLLRVTCSEGGDAVRKIPLSFVPSGMCLRRCCLSQETYCAAIAVKCWWRVRWNHAVCYYSFSAWEQSQSDWYYDYHYVLILIKV